MLKAEDLIHESYRSSFHSAQEYVDFLRVVDHRTLHSPKLMTLLKKENAPREVILAVAQERLAMQGLARATSRRQEFEGARALLLESAAEGDWGALKTRWTSLLRLALTPEEVTAFVVKIKEVAPRFLGLFVNDAPVVENLVYPWLNLFKEPDLLRIKYAGLRKELQPVLSTRGLSKLDSFVEQRQKSTAVPFCSTLVRRMM